jgi:UDP:flavonoid glycosyltransferase YjiC (YdhE family)
MPIKIINKTRLKYGMAPIKNQGEYAPSNAFNLLLYSHPLGDIDHDWKYQWEQCGYCFYDSLSYDKTLLDKYLAFIKKDKRPVLFFTVGSVNVPRRDVIADWLLQICKKNNYRLVIGSSWKKIYEKTADDDLFVLDGIVPHNLVIPHCTALVHHGGSGTTHSAARAGKPQLICSAFIDQAYWADRLKTLGLGSGDINTKKIKFEQLEKKVVDIMTNPVYKKNAAEFREKFRTENSLDRAVNAIEKVFNDGAA